MAFSKFKTRARKTRDRVASFPCRAWDYLCTKRPFWAVVLVIVLLAWPYVKFCDALGSACVFATPPSADQATLFSSVLSNPSVRSNLTEWLPTLFAGGLLFLWVICPQRNAVIRALVEGYYKNFIRVVISPLDGVKKKMVILKPQYGVLDDVERYQDTAKTRLEGAAFEVHFKVLGEKSKQRTVWAVTNPQAPGKEVFVDLARNLTGLRDLAEAETSLKVAAHICQPETKYNCLRNEFFDKLHELYSTYYENRIVFVEGDDMEAVKTALIANMR
jgi:hypothetical protein